VARDFLEVATEDRAEADARLRDDPRLATASPFHALVLGDAEAVVPALDLGLLDTRTAGGPLRMTPLAYVCFSRYAQPDSPRASALVDTAARLLARGADPNARFESPKFPGNPLPCLYGATGYNNNPALARLLIEAGARVDDEESIYHSTEHPDLECLRLLLAPRPPIREHVLKHMLDRDDVTGTTLLLDAGADPNEPNGRGETALHWAVWRDRSPAIVDLLLARGAALEARRIDGRTPYAMAVLFGRGALAAALRDAGAATALSEVDRYVIACAATDSASASAPRPAAPALTPADAHLLPDLADAGLGAAVLGLLAAGIGPEATGEHGATALHFACWRGDDALVAPLLARGADTTRQDRTFRATPPGWLIHGARYCDAPRGDYAAALRALVDAGATVTADEPTGRPEVDAVLRERGVLR
jgi:ankyrin repeat protein